MTTPYWGTDGVEWDALRLDYGSGGTAAPGIVRDISVDREYEVDERKGSGTNGASLTINGEKLARVSIVLEMNNEKHLRRAEYFIDALFPGRKASPKPFDVSHPVLAFHKLKSLFFQKFSGPKRVREGIYTLTLSCLEFAPPPPKPKASATTTPKASKPFNPTTDNVFSSAASPITAGASEYTVAPAPDKWIDDDNPMNAGASGGEGQLAFPGGWPPPAPSPSGP